MNGFSIGQVARRAGLRPSAIRYYESAGLLPAPPRLHGWRRYGEDIFTTLAAIDLARHAGFSLAEIRTLLVQRSSRATAGTHWISLTRQKLRDVDDLIDRARTMKQLLLRGAKCGCVEIRTCPIVGERVAEMRSGRKPGRLRHESVVPAANR